MSGYRERDLEKIFGGRFGRHSRSLNFKADWRAVLNSLSVHADHPKFSITHCSWPFIPGIRRHGNDYTPKLGFICDFAMDVTAALYSLKTLDFIKLWMDFFKQLYTMAGEGGPWTW